MAFARMFNKNDHLVFFLAYNSSHPKLIRAAVTEARSLELFDLVSARLKEISNDSQEADLLIAGMAVRAMVWQDFIDGTSLYPQMEYLAAHAACYGEIDPPFETSAEKLEVLKQWGHCALIEKTLGFEGRMPIFDRPDFIAKLNDAVSSSFNNFTNRFVKYNLTVEEKAEVKTVSPSPTMMYGEY